MKPLAEIINNVNNPFFRVKRSFSRYILITACTGTLSFLTALALLHAGFKPFLTLVLSVCGSGLLNYAALELWGFPHRKGRLSWKRLTGNALVGVCGFGARYGVLALGLKHLAFLAPLDKAVPLFLAYLASFIIGYLLRRHVVFKHNPASIRASGRRRKGGGGDYADHCQETPHSI